MRDIIKPAIVLLLICAVTTAILAVVFNSALPIIEKRTALETEQAKKDVLPGASEFKEISLPKVPETVKKVFAAYAQGQYAGTVCTLVSKGYDASGINLTVGISKDGVITGIKIGDQKETPGLGTNVLNPQGKYLNQYKNLAPKTDLVLVKNKAAGDSKEKIDAVTGATFTSRGVWRAVQATLEVSKMFDAQGGVK